MEVGVSTSESFGVARRTIGPHGYFAYFPKPLPLEIDLKMATVRSLANAEAALGRLAGTGRLLPNPHLLVRPYMVREAVASARIEGTQTTIAEVYEAVVGGKISPGRRGGPQLYERPRPRLGAPRRPPAQHAAAP